MTPLRPALRHAAIVLRSLPLLLIALLLPGRAAAMLGYLQTNLVSDIPGLAIYTDPNLQNAWGLSHSATSPFWVSNNGTGTSTLYRGTGEPQSLVVTLPQDGPTGQVFNSTSDFVLSNGVKASFLFAAEDGSISGWNGAAGTTGVIAAIRVGAVYKGLALGTNANGNYLFAANFHDGTIDVYDKTFHEAILSGAFTDPSLPAGYAPFNIQNIGGQLYVTYALQDGAKHDDASGAGHGFVDVYDTDGNLVRRVVSQGALNSPWGLALAPGDFGQFSNELLVGNFGDGDIDAYDPVSGIFMGALRDPDGNVVSIEGLWGLDFGNGAAAGPTNSLYFTAGPGGEKHGLFGSIVATPEPASLVLLALGLLPAAFALRRKEG
ncbi:MAG TPA: TIGR03118 family protein [Candidatus Saccharimonadales bacterium]|nr:TIGR03118 family protein [Candidatus Saccharimonadales bacterium]